MLGAIKKRKVSKPLSVERLRQFSGLETVSDEEAKEIIDSLDKLSLILYSRLQNIKLHEYERQFIDPIICQGQDK
ncbi:MAG TPA: hypothetical protein VKQ08_00940 [Cyclobacteriaceae bacterium]|nr:hypothetical protein [Cyclobacteriaceae bacterium]